MASSRMPQVFVTEGKGAGARYLLPDVSIVSVETELNGIGSAEISYNPLSENAAEVKLSERELEIQDGDEMVFAGTMRDKRGNSTALSVKSDGLADWFRYRFVLTGNLLYTDTEQLQIAAGLVNYAQDDAEQGTNADLRISIAGFANSGITRTREYISERKHNIFEALSEFSTLEEGFDWEVVPNPDGTRVWTPHFPKKGADLDVLLEYGAEIVDYAYAEAATKQATKIAATGGIAEQVNGERIKQEFTYEDVDASTRYGVHVAVLPSGSRSDIPWLTARAVGGVNARKDVTVIPEVTIKDAHVWRRVFTTGDSVRVRIDHGAVQVGDRLRIKKIQWLPPTNQLKVTFLEPVGE